jgi:hypothetical protein
MSVGLSEEKDNASSSWLEQVVQALNDLGGQATTGQICDQVSRIHPGPLPKSWQSIASLTIYQHSSDTKFFRGKEDLFEKVGKGEWALRDRQPEIEKPLLLQQRKRSTQPGHLHSEPMDEVRSILRTIKEYREFKEPSWPSWKEYVSELFHILGFSTRQVDSRLVTLYRMGSSYPPCAASLFVQPAENFTQMVTGLPWESHLFYAAQYHHAKWGILTNGLSIEVMDFSITNSPPPTRWMEFDKIIQAENVDAFLPIYQAFCEIRDQGPQADVAVPRSRQDQQLTRSHRLRMEFWQQLLRKARARTDLHATISPSSGNWISTGAGKTGLSYGYVVRLNEAQVELYIDHHDKEWNKTVFNALLRSKREIEQRFGAPLDWQALPNKRASRICYVIPEYGLIDEDHWSDLQDRMIDLMIKLDEAFRPCIEANFG